MKLTSKPKPVRFRIKSGGVEHTSLDSLLKHFDFKVIFDNKENFIKWLERIDREKAGKLKEILSSGDEKFIDTYNKVLNLFWGEKDIIDHWISWYENEKENFKHIDSNIQDFPEKLRKIKSFISGNYNEDFDEVDKDVFDKWNKIFEKLQEDFAIGKDLTLGEASVIQFLFAYHMIRSDKKQYFNKKSELLSRDWIFKVLGVEEIREGYDEIGILNKLGFNKLIECDPWYNEKVVLYDQDQQLDILPKIKNSYFPAYYLLEEEVKSDTLKSGRNPGIFLESWFNNIWDYHNHKEGLQGDEQKVKVEISSISKSDPKDDTINRDAIYSWIFLEFAKEEQYSWFPEFKTIMQVYNYEWNDEEKNLKDFIGFFLNAQKYSFQERQKTLYKYYKFNYLIPQINLFNSFVRRGFWFDKESAQNILIENKAFDSSRLANLLEEIFYTSSRDTFIRNFIKLCAFNILEFH